MLENVNVLNKTISLLFSSHPQRIRTDVVRKREKVVPWRYGYNKNSNFISCTLYHAHRLNIRPSSEKNMIGRMLYISTVLSRAIIVVDRAQATMNKYIMIWDEK